MKNIKPNRAHYRIDTHIGFSKWTPTDKVLCVFHARRIPSECYRAVALRNGGSGMSRPIKDVCTECLLDHRRCEHDMQNTICPCLPGDTCGKDSDEELGGSW